MGFVSLSSGFVPLLFQGLVPLLILLIFLPNHLILEQGSARLGWVKKGEYQDAKMILIRGVPALIKDFTDKFIE